jgi:Uma2 family endonuclease
VNIQTQSRFTPEDLLALANAEGYELVEGRFVQKKSTTWAAYIAGRIARELSDFVENHRLGWVFGTGASLQCFEHDASLVYRPAVSFFRGDRLSADEVKMPGHLRLAPDLVVEVLAPDDLAYDIDTKVANYRKAGVKLIWLVNPDRCTVSIYRKTANIYRLRPHDELSGDDVLPGFHCRVADLFQPPPHAERFKQADTTGS